MLSLKKNKKIFLTAGLAIFLTGGIFVLTAPEAKAIWVFDYFSTGGVYKLIGDLLSIIQQFFGLLLTLASNLLEAVFSMGKFYNIPVVTAGWKITRGLCNMFLALILLVMAVSTVLNIGDRFNWKKILPRLIVVALLINFSLLFAGVIIDFSQVMTSYFINAAKGDSTISKQIMNGLNISMTLQGVPDPKTAPPQSCSPPCATNETCRQITDEFGSTFQCFATSDVAKLTEAQIKKGDKGTLDMVIGYAFGTIITMIATFTVLAASLFLIFRIVALWLLLIFSPLAWISMITGTGGLWNKWWDNFFKWTFFAPIYAFFIYLAVLAVGSNSFNQVFNKANSVEVPSGIFNTVGNSITIILQYIVIIVILLGGLFAAQSLGAVGSGAMIKTGKKLQGWGKSALGRTAGRTARFGLDQTAPSATAAAGKVLSAFGFKKGGERLQAKATQMRQSPAERKQHKDYANLLKSMSDKDLLHETKSAFGIRKLIAAREAKERGLLAKTEDKGAVQKAMDTFQAFGVKDEKGKTKEQKELEETRFDVIENEKERIEAIRRSKESGNLEKVNAVVFKNPDVIKSMFKQEVNGEKVPGLIQPEFLEVYKKFGKKTKDAAQQALKDSFDPNANFAPNAEDTKLRNIYASATGNIAEAFTAAGEQMEKAAENAARAFVESMKPNQIGDIFEGTKEGEKSLHLIGQFIKPEVLANARNLNLTQKAYIMNGARGNNNNAVIQYARKSPAWGARSERIEREEREEEEDEPEEIPPVLM